LKLWPVRLNLVLLGVLLQISLNYAERAGLTNPESAAEIRAASRRRIIIYQMLYAVSLLLGMINTYAGIAFLVLLQLSSAADTPTRLAPTTE
jgi:uncharacterized membrane protein